MASTQKLSTTLVLDAFVSSDFKDAFSSANKLVNDLSKHSNALEKELKDLGKRADSMDKIGESSDALRKDMIKLERQVGSTQKAVGKFSQAKAHFRSASIGAKAFKNELRDMAGIAAKAAAGVAGIGVAAGFALSPDDEALEYGDQIARLRIIPEMDEAKLDAIDKQLLELSNQHVNIELPDLADQFNKLSRKFGIEEAQELLPDVANFQTITKKSITGDFQTDLDAIVAAGSITTAEQYKKLLETLSKGVVHGNLNLDNIDSGDLGQIFERYGTDFNSTELQEALLIALKHKELDSEQFADKFREFLTKYNEATFLPEVDANLGADGLQKVLKQQDEAQKNMQTFAKYGLDQDSNLTDLAKTYIGLREDERKQLVHDLEPLLGGEVIDVLLSAPQGLETIIKDSAVAARTETNMQEDADKMLGSWSYMWRQIGKIGGNSANILQKNFAEVFGPPVVQVAQKFFAFLVNNEGKIKNFFTGVENTLSPIITKIYEGIKEAWPHIKEFAGDVWKELGEIWKSISPAVEWLTDKIFGIVKAIGGFLKDHPRLVATVIAGVTAWKLYKVTSTGIGAAYDFIAGGASMVMGHFHKLNATVIGNQRQLAGVGNTALSTGRKFLDMGKRILAMKFPRFAGIGSGLANIGRSALAAIPGIVSMGASLWAAMIPILPVVLPIVAAIAGLAALGVVVYKNWEPLKKFFVDNFETIHTVLMILFPPLGLFIGLAGVIKENWEPLKNFFAEVWTTIQLVAGIAFELVKFVALSAVNFVQDVWGGIKDFFSDVWEGVTNVFTDSPLAPIFEWLVDGVKFVVEPLVNFFSDIWGNVSDLAAGAIDWVTDKFKSLNETLSRWFGWLKDKNKELSDDIKGLEEGKVIKTELDTKDDSPIITKGMKSHIKEEYDINTDKLSDMFAKELKGFAMLEERIKQASTPEELKVLNDQKQQWVKDAAFAKDNLKDRDDRKAIDKIQKKLESDLKADKPVKEYKQPDIVRQYIEGNDLLQPTKDILEQERKQTQLLEMLTGKKAVVEVSQDKPVVNTGTTLIEGQQPIVNTHLPAQQTMIEQVPITQDIPDWVLPEHQQQSIIVQAPQIEQAHLAQDIPDWVLPEHRPPTIVSPPAQVEQAQLPFSHDPVAFEQIQQDVPDVLFEPNEFQQTTSTAKLEDISIQILNESMKHTKVLEVLTRVDDPQIRSDVAVDVSEQTHKPVTVESPAVNVLETQQAINVAPAQIVEIAEMEQPLVNVNQPIQENSPVSMQPIISPQAPVVEMPAQAQMDIPELSISEVLADQDKTLVIGDTLVEQPEIIAPELETIPVQDTPPGAGSMSSVSNVTHETTHQSTTNEGSPQIVVNLTVNATNQDDGDELAEKIAAVLRKELDGATQGFLTQ